MELSLTGCERWKGRFRIALILTLLVLACIVPVSPVGLDTKDKTQGYY